MTDNLHILAAANAALRRELDGLRKERHVMDEKIVDLMLRHIGVINEVVPHEELLPRARALAQRLARVPPDSVRLNKAMTTYALEAMGLRNALNVNAFLSTIVSSSNDGPDIEHLDEARKQGGLRAFLEARDGPFQPEPFGPRSRPR